MIARISLFIVLTKNNIKTYSDYYSSLAWYLESFWILLCNYSFQGTLNLILNDQFSHIYWESPRAIHKLAILALSVAVRTLQMFEGRDNSELPASVAFDAQQQECLFQISPSLQGTTPDFYLYLLQYFNNKAFRLRNKVFEWRFICNITAQMIIAHERIGVLRNVSQSKLRLRQHF